MEGASLAVPLPATCKLCSPNCKQCSISYTNCISCKTGWALLVTVDASNVMVADTCVPSDGLSHWHHVTATHSRYETGATNAFVTNECLQGFLERPTIGTAALNNLLIDVVIGTTITTTGSSSTDYPCYAGQCHATCYTCLRHEDSQAINVAGAEAVCTSCRSGWYLSETANYRGYNLYGTC